MEIEAGRHLLVQRPIGLAPVDEHLILYDDTPVVDRRLNATRLRLEIAALLLEIGEANGAAAEIRAASAVADELGSDKLKTRAAALRQQLSRTT